MLVRTITQLPEPSGNSFTSGYVEMSIPSDLVSSKYTSYKVAEKTIAESINNQTSTLIEDVFGLRDSRLAAIKVNSMLSAVDVLSSGNQIGPTAAGLEQSISGIKCFSYWPAIRMPASSFPVTLASDERLSGYQNYLAGGIGDLVPNVSKVNDIMLSQPVYFSTEDSIVAEGNPLPSNTTSSGKPGTLSYQKTIGSGKFYFWRIEQNSDDSSEYVYDTRSNSIDGYEEMRDTGQLVMWGWLADNGTVEAQNAWVGLFASMKSEGNDTTQTIDIPISIQPWIRGQYASTLQYVSFNVPVKKGLKLKVKTGFQVSNANSGFQSGNTLTFTDRWVPNAFFGYIIKS